MSRFTKSLAIILTVAIIAPAPLLIAPQRTYAQWTTFQIGDVAPTSLLDLAKNTLT